MRVPAAPFRVRPGIRGDGAAADGKGRASQDSVFNNRRAGDGIGNQRPDGDAVAIELEQAGTRCAECNRDAGDAKRRRRTKAESAGIDRPATDLVADGVLEDGAWTANVDHGVGGTTRESLVPLPIVNMSDDPTVTRACRH